MTPYNKEKDPKERKYSYSEARKYFEKRKLEGLVHRIQLEEMIALIKNDLQILKESIEKEQDPIKRKNLEIYEFEYKERLVKLRRMLPSYNIKNLIEFHKFNIKEDEEYLKEDKNQKYRKEAKKRLKKHKKLLAGMEKLLPRALEKDKNL